MPKKRGRKKGVTLGLSDFLGPEAHKDALPTAPRADDGSGDRGGRYGGHGGYDRNRRDDRPPMKSDMGHWRNVGRSGGGGGGFQDSRFGGSRNQDSRFGVSTNNRFESSGETHNPWRRGGGGGQDVRGGGDSRPAYLRNRFRKVAEPEPQQSRGPSVQDKERLDRAKAKEAAKEEQVQEAKQERAARANTYSEDLQQVKTVAYANAKSPLETACVDLTALSEDALVESFQRLDLSKTEPTDIGIVLGNSLVDSKFTVEYFLETLTKVESSKDRSSVAGAVMKNLKSKGNIALRNVLGEVDRKEVLAAVNPGLSGEEFEKFLDTEELAFLKPLPDLSPEVIAAFDSGASVSDILAIINAKLEPTQFPVKLAPIIHAQVYKRVFVSKTVVKYDVIAEYAPLLLRVQEDLESEKKVLFACQFAWKKNGGQRKFILPLFKALYDAQVVSFEALAGWRDDRTKSNSKGKAQALLGTNNWITEITPPPEEESDEEEDDEEDQQTEQPQDDFMGL